jgi:hypothetical protein
MLFDPSLKLRITRLPYRPCLAADSPFGLSRHPVSPQPYGEGGSLRRSWTKQSHSTVEIASPARAMTMAGALRWAEAGGQYSVTSRGGAVRGGGRSRFSVRDADGR